MASSFAAQVSAWVAETKKRQEAVYKESALRVFILATTPVGKGGNLPKDTGFLQNSAAVTLDGSIPAKRYKPKDAKAYADVGRDELALVIARATTDKPITLAFTANYARYVENGARGRAGRKFVGLAAQQWPRIVADVCQEAQTRATR